MIKYICDLCGEELKYPFREQDYFKTKDDKSGMSIVRITTKQGELCEKCARSIAADGKVPR